ncbi:MAG: Hsp70 family protein [Planctomycetes bacterium]|nr:Hsp70 family protein [Planctomycetota bacterium]
MERVSRLEEEKRRLVEREERALGEVEQLARAVAQAEEAKREALREFKDEMISLYEEKERLIADERERMAELERSRAGERDARERLGASEERARALEARSRDLEARVARLERSRAEGTPAAPEVDRSRWVRRADLLRRQIENLLEEANMLRRELAPRAPSLPRSGLVPGPVAPAEEAAPEAGSGAQSIRAFQDLRSVGFDFGTTTTVLSYYKELSQQGIFEIGLDPKGGYRRLAVPSVLGYLEDEDRFVFGEEAADLPANLRGYRKIPSVKRCLLCEGVNEAGQCANLKNAANHDICGQGVRPWHLGGRRYETEELIGMYLHHLLSRVEKKFGVRLDPARVHFTVPVYFGFVARKKMRDGVRRAFAALRGADVETIPADGIVLLHEPSAAAVSQYNQFREVPDEVFCVFDMGGGTTDVAVFEKRKGELWCLASGSAQVGGDNLDQILKEIVAARVATWPVQAAGVEARRTLARLHDGIAELREELSREEEVRRTLVLPEGEFVLAVSRAEFDARAERTVGRAIDVLVRTYETALPILERFGKTLAGVYLVGGVTRMPLLRRRVVEALRARAPGMEVRQPSRFPGVEVAPATRELFEKEFHILSVALGAGFGIENFREYVLDKIPFEIGLVLSRDRDLREYPAKNLLPFYHAFEPVPKTVTHEVLVSQNPGNVLNLYMKREGESFYKIIKYLKFPYRQGRRLRYMPADERIDEVYRIRMEVTKDLILVQFGDIAREKVFVPGCHPYYIQKDLHLEWVERLSTVQDFEVRSNGFAERVDAVRLQEYLRRSVQEAEPVRILANFDGRLVVVHGDRAIGYLQSGAGTRLWEVDGKRAALAVIKEDILLPEDVAGSPTSLNPSFLPGDKFVVYDIRFEEPAPEP